MRTVYLDEKCFVHANEQEGFTAIEVDMLDGFSDDFIEGLMIVPEGRSAKHPDGRILKGFTVAPWKDSAELDSKQHYYERKMAADYKAACEEMGIKV